MFNLEDLIKIRDLKQQDGVWADASVRMEAIFFSAAADTRIDNGTNSLARAWTVYNRCQGTPPTLIASELALRVLRLLPESFQRCSPGSR